MHVPSYKLLWSTVFSSSFCAPEPDMRYMGHVSSAIQCMKVLLPISYQALQDQTVQQPYNLVTLLWLQIVFN